METKKKPFVPTTPSQLKIPAFLMCFPFTLSIDDPNNVWMEELKDDEKTIDYDRAFTQYLELYNYIAAGSLTYLLPSKGNYQDQVYVANLGIYLPHLTGQNVVILSNYRSKPRRGEDEVGREFFEMMQYKVFQSPHHWEGEADLKFIRENVFVGGYGIRTNPKTYKWMAEKFNMDITPVLMQDEYLYHFDCLFFPLNSEKALVGTSLLEREDIKNIEKVVEIIDVPEDMCFNGLTNSCRFENMVLTASPLSNLERDDKRYQDEKDKADFLSRICSQNGMESVLFNLDVFELSGAMLSCKIMHLNYVDYQSELV